MESSNNLLKIFNIIFPYRDFLYILQQEEYFTSEYFSNLPRFFFRRNIEKRDTLKITSRIQTTWIVTIIYQLFTIICLWIATPQILVPVVFIIFLTPFFIALANITLNPLYHALKKGKQRTAQLLLAQNSNTKVIAVAGSFGKTTTKNLIYEMIRYNYKTQLIEGNLNTPIGVAQWIINNFDKNTEYLIVEMDAFVPGAIREIIKITPPYIAVITNIKDQHMTRFASHKTLIKAHEELFEVNNNILFVAHDNVETHKRPIQLIKVPSSYYAKQSESFRENAQLAITVAKHLGVSDDLIKDTINKFAVPDRRQQLTQMHGYEVVDDSYNISLTTAQAAIDYGIQIAREKKKQLLVITAGIPESENHKKTNEALGEYLEKYSSHVVVLKSIFAKFISKQLKSYSTASDLTEAWTYIKHNYKQEEVLIVFLPELTDLYY